MNETSPSPTVVTPSWLSSMFARAKRLPSKPPMIAYLGFLLLLGAWFRRDGLVLWHAGVILILYSALDLLIGHVHERKWILPSSAWVSGLILSLVLTPTAPWSLVIAAPILASLSKHIIRLRRKHLFNPAGFSLVALGFAVPTASVVSWWGASWGLIPLVLVAASGLFTIVRVKRWRTWLAFAVAYLVGSSLVLLSRGAAPADLRALVLDGTFWFFSTVMLIEPVTTAYTPAVVRTWFGAAVGILVIVLSAVSVPLPDPFLVSLLLGNLGARLGSRILKK